MSAPSIVVVVDDTEVRTRLVADLVRRFGGDYDVTGVDSAASPALLGDRSGRVACVIAAPAVTGAPRSGVELLAGLREHHPEARRVLLVERGAWRRHPVRRAMVLGQVDSYIFDPWYPREQFLYLPMSEYLADWSRTQPPEQPAVRLVGQRWDERSRALRDVLSRGSIPFEFHEHGSSGAGAVLEAAGLDSRRLPVMVFFTGEVLVAPSDTEVAQALGFRSSANRASCDIAVIGAGPAGLSAAVYAASEGLRTTLIDPGVPGGQAGTSSMIRNYLGFPRGLTGAGLTSRAVEQAWLFGTEIVLGQPAVSLHAEGDDRVVTTAGGRIRAGTVVIATGMSWRRIGVPGVESLVGCGVFYGAAGSEAQALQGRHTYVVGGGNSAGQVAVHLARYAESTTIVIRRGSLTETMSDYLVRQVEALPNLHVRPHTEVTDACGDGLLEELVLRDRRTGASERVPASGLFVMIGGEPRTDWLAGTLARDEQGYLLTGPDIAPSAWPLTRAPRFVETSMPGVFAAGDVRHGSTRRIAPSVGAGGIAVQLAHEYLTGLE